MRQGGRKEPELKPHRERLEVHFEGEDLGLQFAGLHLGNITDEAYVSGSATSIRPIIPSPHV